MKNWAIVWPDGGGKMEKRREREKKKKGEEVLSKSGLERLYKYTKRECVLR